MPLYIECHNLHCFERNTFANGINCFVDLEIQQHGYGTSVKTARAALRSWYFDTVYEKEGRMYPATKM